MKQLNSNINNAKSNFLKKLKMSPNVTDWHVLNILGPE